MIYIIILNWNKWIYTKRCLESILNSEYKSYKILLIDNGSDDTSVNDIAYWLKVNDLKYVQIESKQCIDGKFKICTKDLNTDETKLFFVKNCDNLGFSAGVNVGIKYALEKKADYVMFLNNDTIIKPDTIGKLCKFYNNNPNIAGVTPLILREDNKKIWSAGTFINFYGKLDRKRANKMVEKGIPFKVDFITGCASLYLTKTFKKIGLLSENSFHGGEDLEFSLRIKNNNMSLCCIPNSVVMHSVGKSTDSFGEIGSMYANYLVNLICYRKYFGVHYWIIWINLYTIAILRSSIFRHKLTLERSIHLIYDLYKLTSRKRKLDKQQFFLYLGKSNKIHKMDDKLNVI